jgi:multiple sugar transport system substrate-binding protein
VKSTLGGVSLRWWVIASAIGFALTSLLLPGIRASVSYRPIARGCGEHDGLVIGADVDVSPDFQRRRLIESWNAQLEKYNSGKAREQRATLVEVSRSTDATRSELAAALDSGSCAYDVVLADIAWIPEYIRRGFLTKVDDSWIDDRGDFFDQVLATGRSQNGEQYAVPWFTDAGLLYVRQGDRVPGTWDELLRQGYSAQLKNYEGLTVNALEVIWNTQRQQVLSGVVDRVDERTAQVVLQGLQRLANAGAPLAESRAYAEDDSLNAFVGRRGVPMRNWPYAFRVLAADPRVRDRFDVYKLPGSGLNVLGGWDLAVSRRSRHKAAAGALIKTLTGKNEQYQMMVCGGYTPTRRSAFANPRPCDDPKYRPEELPSPERFQEFAKTVQAAVFSAAPRPVTPYYAQFSETFRGCAVQVLGGHPPTAAKLASALTDALHGRNGGCRTT